MIGWKDYKTYIRKLEYYNASIKKGVIKYKMKSLQSVLSNVFSEIGNSLNPLKIENLSKGKSYKKDSTSLLEADWEAVGNDVKNIMIQKPTKKKSRKDDIHLLRLKR